MKSSLLLIYLYVVHIIVTSVRSSSEVTRSNSTYKCCDQHVVSFNPNWDLTWSENDTPFAYYRTEGSQSGCMTPCKEIKEGVMLLDKCVDLQAKTVRKTSEGTVKEERINFMGVPCSGSLLAPGSVILLLLPLHGAII